MRAITLFILTLLALPPAAAAQTPADDSPMAARLSAETASSIEPGLYAASENRTFILQPYGGRMLLRFSDAPETFVLTVDRASLGAKVLKYDTGATALRVSVWGGLTLYTQADPSGLPATRQGDAPAAAPTPAVSAAEMTAALRDEASHLNYTQKTALHFMADTNDTADDAARAVAFEALINTGLGIERFLATDAARKALAGHLETVKLVAGPRPQVSLTGRTMVIGFAPALGLAGSPSSHAVAHRLGKLLAVATAE